MTGSLYLKINGIGYIVLGLLCAILPSYTAELVGFTLLGQKGVAEYVAVYGGLEFGMGVFFLLCLPEKRQFFGILYGLCVYVSLVFFRVSAMVANGPTSDFGWLLFSLESLFFIWSVWLYRREISAEARAL